MQCGFFFQLPCAPWQTERARYSDTLAQIEYGDRLGFDTACLPRTLCPVSADVLLYTT